MEALSLIAAGLSLVVSFYAVVVAKREPARARTRANRDIVRDALRRVLKGLDGLTSRLTRGEPVGEVDNSISAAQEILAEYKSRLPDRPLMRIDAQLLFVSLPWDSARRAEGRVEQTKGFIHRLQERLDEKERSSDYIKSLRADIRAYEDEVSSESRRRDAAVQELRDAAKNLRELVTSYVGELDAADRNEET